MTKLASRGRSHRGSYPTTRFRQRSSGNMEEQTGYHYCLAVLADTSESAMRALYAESCRPVGAGVGGGKGKSKAKLRRKGGWGEGSAGGSEELRFEMQSSLSQWLLENTNTMACAKCRQFI